MSGFVICLVVVGAAIAVVAREVGRSQPATEDRAVDREGVRHARVDHDTDEMDEMDDRGAPEPRGPRHFAPGSATDEAATDSDDERPVGHRIRSGVLLVLLVTALGAAAAVGVGFLVVILLTAVRTAIS